MPFDKKFPETVQFWNEHGQLTNVPLVFEWQPIVCQHCKGVGHEMKDNRLKQKKIWAPKKVQPVVNEASGL